MAEEVWLFGYGSLIWRPDITHQRAVPARLEGYERRFWQGSHDHRGVPDAPGRVVTLIPGQGCDGIAFALTQEEWEVQEAALDFREKNGYAREAAPLRFHDGSTAEAVVYFARPGNFAWLGDAPLSDIATQIAASSGPSGANAEYLFELADALRDLNAVDEHVFALDALVRSILPS